MPQGILANYAFHELEDLWAHHCELKHACESRQYH